MPQENGNQKPSFEQRMEALAMNLELFEREWREAREADMKTWREAREADMKTWRETRDADREDIRALIIATQNLITVSRDHKSRIERLEGHS